MSSEELARAATLRCIVVATDGSDLSTYALGVAAQVAQPMRARVVAVHVRHIENVGLGAAAAAGSVDAGEFFEAEAEVAKGARDSATKVLGAAGLTAWTYEERTGPPVETLVAAIKEHGADLVVVGSHGHHPLYDLVVGSIAQGLVGDAPASVLVARPPRTSPAS